MLQMSLIILGSLLFLVYMGTMSRLAGNGFGKQWGVPWLPEVLFTAPFGLALGYVVYILLGIWFAVPIGALGWLWSYGFMQSGTWMFLRWTKHKDPNTTRKATLKPIIDFLGKLVGADLGEEEYSWIAASVKGFLIGLPVGGIPLAILWPLGYEIGSHFDNHAVSEVSAGVGAGIAILVFLMIFHMLLLGL